MRAARRSRVGLLLAAALGFALLLGAACSRREAPVPRAENLLLITLDTTRRDHLPTYGYGRITAPAIDVLASRSTVFTQAFSQEVNTNPSHASMLTGLYPHVHGNRANGQRLAPERRTLPQLLAPRGFRCGAFVSGFTMLAKVTGFDRGFEVYDDELTGHGRRAGEETVDRALAWLGGLDPEERFFLFVHFYDPHGPYQPRGRYRALFTSPGLGPRLRRMPAHQVRRGPDGKVIRRLNPYQDAYDGLIRTADDQVLRLLGAVDLEETAVFLLADHGESLGGRFWGLAHGTQPVDEQIRIPFLIHLPGERPGRVDALVETVDLAPTALEAVGVPAPGDLSYDGRSLMSLVRGEEGWERRRFVFASARAADGPYRRRGYRLDPSQRIHTVRSRRWKLVVYPGVEGEIAELYDLRADPGETTDVLAQHPGVVRGLHQALEAWLGGAAAEVPEPDLTREETEALRSLGYLGD